ncbi:hypothetical protein GFS31_10510 [Leptolyngbya sp. BL0902]|uniref:nuclease A inhibitor family protein n=1 Tax=Leptolyngbya sp. BL0902 TaxID=1115757 RepID=UPI0018E7188B|nr:nuclease A inhibitor family protein [Leptolyngbya sp. BL0902]QQE64371.1 hypothetical protein GFS31_10510 [Leptolyngbya sp. BL0902]
MVQALSDDSFQADVEHLSLLTTDLWYPSETDAPVTVVAWPAPLADPWPPLPSGSVVTEHPADQFFRPILSQPFWHSAQGEHLAQRYQALQDFLYTHLTNLRTYRVGQVEVTLSIMGHHASGGCLGVQTTLVET